MVATTFVPIALFLMTEIEVNDMFGMMTSNHIVWADPETHRVYHIYSKDVTGEELLKVAESISETTP